MSRRHRAEKRTILPDAKYNDLVLAKFMNAIMLDGKKSTAERIVYGALDIVEGKAKTEPVRVFHDALENIKPAVEVRSRRVGGATYQVPVEVAPRRQTALALRWIIAKARARSERTMKERLANELIDAFNKKGESIKQRENAHKMAEANRAFAHFRW